MLIDLMLACQPALSIMDGVIGMEGAGPSRGTPARIGAVLASVDAIALDVVASAMIGLGVDDVYTSRAAARRGLGPKSVDDVPVTGDDWQTLSPKQFSVPTGDLATHAPAWLAPRLTHWIMPRPVLELAHACTRCKKCEQSCPVKAIEVGSLGPQFDYKTCIRCYCCEEVCPERAISTKAPLAARIFVRQP
jgi:Pyruvate/2-oxoacid:ferredoxin oxidoreductase delta subunit